MKIITLLPVKNEAWILEYSLKNFSKFSDYIIIADQMSTDGSREIYKKFPKVRTIDNKEIYHSNIVRWKLLDEARKYGKNNLIICLDADEIVLPNSFDSIKENGYKPGQSFEMPWIQLWKSSNKYRVDSGWDKLTKICAFIDDENQNYQKKFVINDHTARVPESNIPAIRIQSPLLHLEYIPFEKSQLKQAWYRCSELINGKRNAKRINATYSVTLDNDKIRTQEIPKEWLDASEIPNSLSEIKSSWHKERILKWFDEYGILFFEPLQIWHIKDLRNEFVKKNNREPISKTYPSWVLKINNLKNKLKNIIK